MKTPENPTVRTRVEATVWLWLDLDPAAGDEQIAQAVQDDIGYAGVVVVNAEAVEYAS